MQKNYHKEQAAKAKVLYTEAATPDEDAKDWNAALSEAERLIDDALQASNNLRDIPSALFQSGKHARIFRHVLAPPLSQDRFALYYPAWKKDSEKDDGSKVKLESAQAVSQAVDERRSTALTPWLSSGRQPAPGELARFSSSVGSLIASQEFATVRRNRLARAQENAVLALLQANDWIKLASSLLAERGMLPTKHYMHKPRYATTKKGSTHEVDIALGLKDTFVLAIECKVTNDKTNSIKRVNDVLKKAHAWRKHFGSFVKPAAVLQGVIADGDVDRLLDDNVEVFWSHDLPHFEQWLSENI